MASPAGWSAALGGSRTPRRRRGARRHVAERTQQLVECLCELDGFPQGFTPDVSVSPVPPEARELLSRRVVEFGVPPSDLAKPADGTVAGVSALRQILGSHADYAGEARTVVPLDLARIAVPKAGSSPVSPFVSDDPRSPYSPEGFFAHCMLPKESVQERLAACEVSKPFLDKGLAQCPRKYATLVARLVESGVVEMSSDPGLAQVGVFAVAKKSGAQRLVVDARLANCYFAEPPSTALPTGAAFSQIRADHTRGLFFGGLDLRDYFYHLTLPEALRPYFMMPPVLARLHKCEHDTNGAKIYPRFRVIPMGWTHALDLAQNFFAHLVSGSLGRPRSHMLCDGEVPCSTSVGIPAVYVDNFIFMADNAEATEVALNCVASACDKLGLPYHEQFHSSRTADLLGWSFDGVACSIRPKQDRAWRLWLALEEVQISPMLTSRQLEVIIGHFTFLALLRRPLLSLMGSVYSLCARKFVSKRLLWPSVVRELRWMQGLLPLCLCELASPMSGVVGCSDASLDGGGGCHGRQCRGHGGGSQLCSFRMR